MLAIRLAGRPLSLLPGTTLSLEISSPLFDEDDVLSGTFIYTFSLPLDDTNRFELGYPDIIENVADLRRRYDDCEVEDDGFVVGRAGELRIRRITPTRVEVAVGFGMSQLAPELKERQLQDFEFGGERSVAQFVDVEGVQVPGLVLHANATVDDFDAYDYVFAPLRNHHSEANPPVPTLLNQWVFAGQSLFGLPAGGTFTFAISFTVPGGIAAPPGPLTRLAPLPKLVYVAETVLREMGVSPVRLRWPQELQQLVLLSATEVGSVFRLADSMPGMSVKQFFLVLRRALGSVPLFAPGGGVELVLLADVLASTDYDDWSHLAAPDYTDRDIPEAAGKTLVYSLASGDTQAEAYFRPPTGAPLAPPVATVADLPVPVVNDPALLPLPELRLVVAEAAYYLSTQVFDFINFQHRLRWSRHAGTLPPVDVAGGGQRYEQGIAATALEVTSTYGNTALDYREDMLVPCFTQQPFVPQDPASERPADLRLGFYRGRQPSRIDAAHPYAAMQPSYPLVTPYTRDAAGQRVGEYSLQLHGADGTATRLLGGWLALLANATPVKRSFYLTAEHLASLALSRKKRIDGMLYLVKHVAVQLPVRKAAVVTLIPLPNG